MNIFIDEDFFPETMEYRKQLWKEVKELRRKGNIAYHNYRSVVNKGMKRITQITQVGNNRYGLSLPK